MNDNLIKYTYIKKSLFLFFTFGFLLNISLANTNIGLSSIIFYFLQIFIFIFFIFEKIQKNFFFLITEVFVFFIIFFVYTNFCLGLLINHFYFGNNLEFFLKSVLFTDFKNFFYANGLLNLYCLLLLITSSALNRSNIIKIINNKFETNNYNLGKIKIVIFLISILIYIYYSLGIITNPFSSKGFNIIGNQYDSDSWYAQFYYFIISMHLVLNQLYFFISKKLKNFNFLFLIISILINGWSYFIISRRYFVFFILINIALFIYINFIKITKFKILLSFVLSLIFINSSSLLFQKIRGIDSQYFDNDNIIKTLQKNKLAEVSKKQYYENLSFRLFLNHEVGSILYYKNIGENHAISYDILKSQIIRAIPQIIYPNKENFPAVESLTIKKTNSPLFLNDTVDSILSYSYFDFGYLGIIVYTIIFSILIYIFNLVLLYKINYNFLFLSLIVYFYPHITIGSVETNLTVYLVAIRNIILFYFLMFYLEKFLKKETNENK